MSDERLAQRYEKWTKEINLPDNQGKKKVKIELFEAKLWRDKCRPSSTYKVKPYTCSPEELNGLYRLMIDGKWHQAKGYHLYFLTYQEALKLFEEI